MAVEEWVTISREMLDYGMLPWIGRKREGWLRTWVRPHPVDRLMVLVPRHIHRVYTGHLFRDPVTKDELDAMSYPRLPTEDDLRSAPAPLATARPRR